MKYLKTYESLFSDLFIDTRSNKWFRMWSDVWYIPIKYHEISLIKIVGIKKAEYLSTIINDNNGLDRTHVLFSKKNNTSSLYTLNNNEIDEFKNIGIYNGAPEITQEDIDQYNLDKNTKKYNL